MTKTTSARGQHCGSVGVVVGVDDVGLVVWLVVVVGVVLGVVVTVEVSRHSPQALGHRTLNRRASDMAPAPLHNVSASKLGSANACMHPPVIRNPSPAAAAASTSAASLSSAAHGVVVAVVVGVDVFVVLSVQAYPPAAAAATWSAISRFSCCARAPNKPEVWFFCAISASVSWSGPGSDPTPTPHRRRRGSPYAACSSSRRNCSNRVDFVVCWAALLLSPAPPLYPLYKRPSVSTTIKFVSRLALSFSAKLAKICVRAVSSPRCRLLSESDSAVGYAMLSIRRTTLSKSGSPAVRSPDSMPS